MPQYALLTIINFLQQVLDRFGTTYEFLHEQNELLEAQAHAVAAQKQHYERLFKLAPDGYLVTDAAGRILFANRVIAAQLGVQEAYLIGKPLLLFIAPGCRDSFYTKLNQLNSADPISQFTKHQWDIAFSLRNGKCFDAAITLAVSHAALHTNADICLLWIIRDVTQQKQLERQTQYLAFYDGLTGLPNRKRFNQCLSDRLSTLDTNAGESAAVALMDIDRFKQINDSYGHSTGDALLTAVTERIAQYIRTEDELFRWAGDEFALVLNNITADELATFSKRLLGAIKRPFHLDNCTIYTTASIGITLCRAGEDSEVVLRRADMALYQAKHQGRSRYCYYRPSIMDGALDGARLEQDLRRLLADPETAGQELTLYFQPQVHCPGRKIVAIEALVRWQHPQLGLLSPNAFINMAETSDLILPLGEWVLWEAIRQAKIWNDQGFQPVLAVNVSPRQFQQPGLAALVKRILDTTGYKPHQLELEVTETLAIDRLKTSRCNLLDLAEIGINLAIDDFGVGYSALARLKQLPVNKLKIDSSLIADLGQDTANDAIVAAIIALAKGLSLKVVAEGVQTQTQLDVLHGLGCHIMQGNRFAAAMPTERVLDLLASPHHAIAC